MQIGAFAKFENQKVKIKHLNTGQRLVRFHLALFALPCRRSLIVVNCFFLLFFFKSFATFLVQYEVRSASRQYCGAAVWCLFDSEQIVWK